MQKNSLAIKVVALVSVIVVGCASGGVGPRIGADIPMSGVGASGDVTSTSSQIGFIGGLTFEGLLNTTWGFRADPQVRTIGGTAGFSGATATGDGIVSATGEMTTNVTFVDLPVMVTFSPIDSTATIQPYLSFGAMLTGAATQTVRASGTQTYTEGGQSASAPFSSQSTGSGLGGPFASVIFAGGIRIPLSALWEWRIEARLQQLITDADVTSYTLYTNSYREVASVTMSAPTTTLGITLGLMLRL